MKKQIQLLGLAILLLIMPFYTLAQKGLLKKANEYYEFFAFSEAIPKYVQVLKKDSSNAEVLIKLADCYRLTNNNQKALETYSKVITFKEATELHKFLYAQALMKAGKYEDAKSFMSTYTLDERGKIFAKSIDEIKRFYKYEKNYKISKTTFNSPKNDFCPAIWKDNSIVFTSSRVRSHLISYKNAWNGDNYDVIYITKKVDGEKYSKPSIFSELIQTRYNDGSASFSKDGNYIYFTRNNIVDNVDIRGTDGKINLQIFQAKLNKYNHFADVKEFFYNSPEYSCAHPSTNANGTILYFSSDMPGGFGGMDLWVSYKKDTTWGKPINLGPKINTAGNEVFPYAFNDKALYFSSNGLDGMGGLDIYKVLLNDEGKPKDKLYNLGAPINSPSDDFGIVFYPEGNSGYYSSNFGNANNDDDIFAFTIVTPVIMELNIKGTITDNQTNKVIPDAKVTLKDEAGTAIGEVLTDEFGNYSLMAEYDKEFNITCQKETYYDATPKSVSTKVDLGISEIIADLTLEKKSDILLIISVLNKKDSKPLDSVKIELLDNLTSKNDVFRTSPKGEYILSLKDKKIGDNLNYAIRLSKNGYVTKNVKFNKSLTSHGDIKISEYLDKLEIGVDLGKLAKLNPIYFDMGKYNIRPDAAEELDKVVKFMKEYSTVVIELGAHTDCRGTANSNLVLSEKRAQASVAYLVSQGIEKDRLSGKGYGESNPVNQCECEGKKVVPCSEVEHQQNRRTEFIVVRFK
jgi:outer membrane protein OmpA-like peptidoglycan-associated protein/tetratricopeptide (TPR) repeat protein